MAQMQSPASIINNLLISVALVVSVVVVIREVRGEVP